MHDTNLLDARQAYTIFTNLDLFYLISDTDTGYKLIRAQIQNPHSFPGPKRAIVLHTGQQTGIGHKNSIPETALPAIEYLHRAQGIDHDFLFSRHYHGILAEIYVEDLFGMLFGDGEIW